MLAVSQRAAASFTSARDVTIVGTERPSGATLSERERPPGIVPEPLAASTRMASLRATLFNAEVEPVRVDRFILLGLLGAGGMGMVYAAYDPRLDRRVALKLVHQERRADAQSERRALREAKAMARVSHPNVVQLYEAGVCEGRMFLAMELVEGTTLSAWLREENRGWRELLGRFVSAGRGLAAAHAAGLVHGDFKPDNVLVGVDDRVRVTDFGLARHLPSERAPSAADWVTQLLARDEVSRGSTSAGGLAGTPKYMAPEQFLGEKASAASDQFSFCVALFQALYGVHPFPGERPAALARAVLEGEIRRVPRSAVPRRVRDSILRGLARAPAERFPSMDALLVAMGRRPPRRAVIGLAGAGFVATLGLGSLSGDPCEQSGDTLRASWEEVAQGRVRAAYGRSSLADAERLGRSTEQMLDTYVDAAAGELARSCREHRAGIASAALHDLRGACLRRRMDVVLALSDRLASGEPEALRAGPEAAASLDDLAGCDDIERLLLGVEAPSAEQRAEQHALSRDLASVRAAELLGDLTRAVAELDGSLLARARTLGYAPTLAEALYRRGRLAVLERDFVAARGQLQESLDLAIRSRHDRLAVELRSWLIQALIQGPSAVLDTQSLLDEADAWLERGNATKLERADFELTRSFALQLRGEARAAERASRRALLLRSSVYGSEHLSVAIAEMSHAQHLAGLGETDAAVVELRAAYATIRARVGDEHMLTVDALYNLAVTLLDRGDEVSHDEAMSSLRAVARTTGVLRGDESIEFADAQLGFAQAAVLVEDLESAEESLHVALEIYELHPDRADRAYALSLQGVLASKAERLEDALAVHLKARDAFDRGGASDDAAREDCNIGDVLAAMDNHRSAARYYRRSIAGLERSLGADASPLAAPRAGLGTSLLELNEASCEALELLRSAGATASPSDLDRARSRCPRLSQSAPLSERFSDRATVVE